MEVMAVLRLLILLLFINRYSTNASKGYDIMIFRLSFYTISMQVYIVGVVRFYTHARCRIFGAISDLITLTGTRCDYVHPLIIVLID